LNIYVVLSLNKFIWQSTKVILAQFELKVFSSVGCYLSIIGLIMTLIIYLAIR